MGEQGKHIQDGQVNQTGHVRSTPNVKDSITYDELDANGASIHWILHESDVTKYRISKDTGISESTLSRLASGFIPIPQMRFEYAHILTQYAHMVQAERDM